MLSKRICQKKVKKRICNLTARKRVRSLRIAGRWVLGNWLVPADHFLEVVLGEEGTLKYWTNVSNVRDCKHRNNCECCPGHSSVSVSVSITVSVSVSQKSLISLSKVSQNSLKSLSKVSQKSLKSLSKVS